MGGAYYNEIDPFAAATMRELIKAGEIAPGVVDERDIRDVTPIELAGFTQCHFFAGGGVWSYALRRAGWRDEWPIWTGSCPCQPFSAAGKGLGFDDERHLWPAWDWLIDQCRPEFVAGEQVADKGADAWLDLVQADLEGMDYAFGCVPLASAGFGAPNPRHRSFWVAHAAGSGCSGICGCGQAGVAEHRHADGLGNTLRDGAGPVCRNGNRPESPAIGIDRDIPGSGATAWHTGSTGGLAHAASIGHERTWAPRGRRNGFADDRDIVRMADPVRSGLEIGSGPAIGCRAIRHQGAPSTASGLRGGLAERSGGEGLLDPGPVNGFWRDADWLYCRDPKGPRWRPVNSGTFPLAPGTPERVGTVRLSGNAINAQAAKGFIEAVMETLADRLAA